MLKKKIVTLGFLGVLSASILFESNVSASQTKVSEDTSVAACENVSISIYYQDNSTNEITFLVKGTPGSEIRLGIFKYPTGSLASYTSTYIPTSGIANVYVDTLIDGPYTASVEQIGSCESNDGPIFFYI